MEFSLLGVCWDRTQTCRKGAAAAPALLRAAFSNIGTYIGGVDLAKHYTHDLSDIEPTDANDLVAQVAGRLRLAKGLPMMLGGDHSISFAGVRALRPAAFVSFDAHLDSYPAGCHEPWMAHKPGELGHENVSLKVAELGIPVYEWGTRCWVAAEEDAVKKKKIRLVDTAGLKKIKGPIYLSIDFDVLDPAVMLAVSYPEPAGKSFADVVKAVHVIAPKVAALDFVEFTPTGTPLDGIYALIAAKLIYAVMAEIVKAQK